MTYESAGDCAWVSPQTNGAGQVQHNGRPIQYEVALTSGGGSWTLSFEDDQGNEVWVGTKTTGGTPAGTFTFQSSDIGVESPTTINVVCNDGQPTTCEDGCFTLGTSGTFVAPCAGTITLKANWYSGSYGNNTGSFAVDVKNLGTGVTTNYTVNGNDSTGVTINVTSGTSYAYSASGTVSTAGGSTYGPDGAADSANGANSSAWACPAANYGSLAGSFVATNPLG